MKITIDIQENDMSASLDKFMAALEAASDKIDALIAKVEDLENAEPTTSEPDNSDEDIDAATALVDDLNAKLDGALGEDSADHDDAGDGDGLGTADLPVADEAAGDASAAEPTVQEQAEAANEASQAEDEANAAEPKTDERSDEEKYQAALDEKKSTDQVVDAAGGQSPVVDQKEYTAEDGQLAVDAPSDEPATNDVAEAEKAFPGDNVTKVDGGVKIEGTF